MLSNKKILYLYIHVPFCILKCSYCAFYSVARLDMARYFEEGVIRSLEKFDFSGYILGSVYFGGGTPSLVPSCISRILEYIFNNIDIVPNCEITVEANPESIDSNTLDILFKSGVNRLSIGVQSSDDTKLTELGRQHSFNDAVGAYYMARTKGFENISLDVLLAVENQTVVQAMNCIKDIAELSPEHISAYLLKVEPNTRLARREVCLPSDDVSAEIYLAVSSYLTDLGYEHYEVSSFARVGRRAVHNSAYWRLENYLGVGPSAHSCIDGIRYFMPSDIVMFINADNPLELMYQTAQQACGLDEKIMLALRTADGIVFDNSICKDTKSRASVTEFIGLLRRQGLAKPCEEENKLVLTPEGFLVSNSIVAEILERLGL